MARIRSIRTSLTIIWVAFFVSATLLALLMLLILRQGNVAQIDRMSDKLTEDCRAVGARLSAFRLQNAGAAPEDRDLALITQLALYDRPGVEGGFWRADRGFVGYAYPSYEGGVKKTLPTETDRIAAVAASVMDRPQGAINVRQGLREATILAACPTARPDRWAIWTMTRLPLQPREIIYELMIGVVVLLLFVVGSGLWLFGLSRRWSRSFAATEAGLADISDGTMTVPRTGLAEMDRLVDALNQRNERLTAVQAERARLADAAAQNERLTALGRMAAGIAHETRNPIAAILLRAENALAGPMERTHGALGAIIEQVQRVERLIDDLLAYTQQTMSDCQTIDMAPFLHDRAADWSDRVIEAGLAPVMVDASPPLPVRIDPEKARRMIDNLIGNAIRHSPPGTSVTISAAAVDGMVRIDVADEGAGVDPALTDTLFEAFVSGRSDGTGLGLAIAREIAGAHHGRIALVPATQPAAHAAPQGARFRIELPCAS